MFRYILRQEQEISIYDKIMLTLIMLMTMMIMLMMMMTHDDDDDDDGDDLVDPSKGQVHSLLSAWNPTRTQFGAGQMFSQLPSSSSSSSSSLLERSRKFARVLT